MRIRNYLKAYRSAFKAGMIATRCTTGCVIDDANREIIPCILHASQIEGLAESVRVVPNEM